MLRPAPLLLLATALAASLAAAPAETTRTEVETDRSAGVDLQEGTFPVGVCAWARPVSPNKFCVIVNDPRPWLP